MYRLILALTAGTVLALSVPNPRTYHVGRIQTDVGEIVFYRYPQTPNHEASFIRLANAHYWDSLAFNRVIRNFVAQGGCPDTPAGFKGSPYNLAPDATTTLRSSPRDASSISWPTGTGLPVWMGTTRCTGR